MRSQRGQSNVEHLAVLVAVMTIFAAFVVVFPQAGEVLACKLRSVVSVVSGDGPVDCGDAAEKAGEFEPCVVRDRSGEIAAGVEVLFLKGGGKVVIQKQRLSNGKFKVTAVGGAELGGLLASPGAKAELDLGKGSLGGGVEAEVSATGRGEYGATWEFDDEAAATRQVEILRNRVRDAGAQAAGGPIGGFIYDQLGLDDDRPLGDPDVEYVQGGVGVDYEVEAGAGAGLGSQGGGLVALGKEINNKTGETKSYFLAEGKADITGAALKEFGIEAKGSVRIAITRDKTGKATQLTVQHIAGGQVAPPEWLSPAGRGRLAAALQGGGKLETDVVLDLRDGSPAQAAFAAWEADRLSGTPGLARAFAQDGRVQLRVYTGGTSQYGAEANGAFGGKLGFTFGYTDTTADLRGAWEYDRDRGLRESVTCTA